MGVAWLAGQRAGIYPDMDEFAKSWAADRSFAPDMEAATRDARYEGWKRAVAATLTV